MDRELVLNAFLPASGVEDPHRFAGRRDEVEELTDALLTKGSVPLIYGHRGLGKSSLALQMTRIAQGDVELLESLKLGHLALGESSRFIALYVNCSDSTKNLRGILQLMINAVDSLRDQRLQEEASNEYRLIDKTTRRTLSLKVFKSETTKRFEEVKERLDTSKFSKEELLIRLAETLTDVYQQPVLFVIDEVDRVASTAGLASFLKSYSSEYVKFALVGIGTTESELLQDHQSLGRQLVPVRAKPMAPADLASIVTRTEEYLAERDHNFIFAKGVKVELARVAAGFPWFVHLLGQAALVDAMDADEMEIDLKRLAAVLVKLPQRRLAKQFNDLYIKAVRDSPSREYVLRLFAEWYDDNVPTSEIYPKAAVLGVTGPSQYVSHLLSPQYGAVLVRSSELGRLYRFSDEMFKIFVRMRNSIYAGQAAEVRRVFERD